MPIQPANSAKSAMEPQPPWLIFAWWLGPPLAVLLAVLWLWKMLAPLMR